MFDRLVARAGTVTDAADRLVRTIVRGEGGPFAERSAWWLVAGLLAVTTLALLVLGLEATRNRSAQPLAAGSIDVTPSLEGNTYATVAGSVATTYVETFDDLDVDGTQDPDETGIAWYYFLVDPVTHEGLTVRSSQHPDAVFRDVAAGVVIEDAAYVASDLEILASELAAANITLDRTKYIDARVPAAAPVDHDLATDLPADGSPIQVTGTRSYLWLETCSGDPDEDGVCEDGEVDLADIFLFDPVSRRAVTVLTEADPFLLDHPFTGMIRGDRGSVSDATTVDGLDLADDGLSVSPVFLLDDGATPPSAPVILGLAVLTAVGCVVIVIGGLGDRRAFRAGDRLPAAATTMASGEALALRVTGTLRGRSGLSRVRDVPATLVRFALGPPHETTLIVERSERHEGVALGIGELTALEAGTTRTPDGRRPALRVVAGTGPLVLRFETETDRDRAAAELIDETGIGGTT